MSEPLKNPAAVALGSMTSPAKARAARINGRKGGRPKGNSRQRRIQKRAKRRAELNGECK